ncbi:MAG: alanine racemase [Verrucomicrobiota bacterium]|nr:alanine racemase [Verrucomicrobiota bacterium]
MNLEPTRCWAEIDRSALRHNAGVARAQVGARVALMAVIKANAYGHGLAAVAETLGDQVELFGVANLEEAREARAAVPKHPVLILGPALPSEREHIAAEGFIASVSSYEEAAAFDALRHTSPAALNLVVDTGMGRMGCAESDAVAMLARMQMLSGVRVHSVSTHLPVADENAAFTVDQLQRFADLIREMQRRAPGDYQAHALLSAGVLGFNRPPFDLVRAGLMLYGISPLPELQHLLKPVLTLKSRIVLLRDLPAGATISYGSTYTTPRAMRVATVGAGYADGYPRALSDRNAAVLVGGKRCAVLGRVTMDMIVIDVSSVPDSSLGDEVVLMGRQGNEEILATELAQKGNTIAWEIFTGIGMRVRRVYL